MRTKIASLAFLVALSGCAAVAGSAGVNWSEMNPGTPPDYELAKAEAKEAIQRMLKDPESAQYRDTTPLFKTLYNFGLASSGNQQPLWAMCIEVNAKNSYGGYTGFEYWIVKFRNGYAIRDELGVLKAEYDCNSGPNTNTRLAKPAQPVPLSPGQPATPATKPS